LTDGLKIKRHLGLDWLRIGAFAILILYHTALHFGPHPWVVRAYHTYDWLVWPLNAVSPWRLLVLFAVSGYATAAMVTSKASVAAFFKERSSRLLIPLLFGMTVLVPPQSWVRMTVDFGYAADFAHFWLADNFRFGTLFGRPLPHWEHLWFLGYLWAYTALLAGFIAFVRPWRAILTRIGDLLAIGPMVLVLPIMLLVLSRLSLMKFGLTGGGMFDDWVGDSQYIPAFLFGFILAFHAPLWDAVRRWWRWALGMAVAAYTLMMALLWGYGGAAGLGMAGLAAETAADSIMAWSMLIVMLKLADTVLNRDSPWRPVLARAIFPAYLVHQTVIVLVGWALRDFGLPGGVVFLIIAGSVVIASAAAYQLAVRVRWMGPLLGVAGQSPAIKRALAPV
jgi:glucans biosynthesis protein C